MPPIWRSVIESMQSPTDIHPVRGATRHDNHVVQSVPTLSFQSNKNNNNNDNNNSKHKNNNHSNEDDYKFVLIELDSIKGRSENYLNILNSQPVSFVVE